MQRQRPRLESEMVSAKFCGIYSPGCLGILQVDGDYNFSPLQPIVIHRLNVKPFKYYLRSLDQETEIKTKLNLKSISNHRLVFAEDGSPIGFNTKLFFNFNQSFAIVFEEKKEVIPTHTYYDRIRRKNLHSNKTYRFYDSNLGKKRSSDDLKSEGGKKDREVKIIRSDSELESIPLSLRFFNYNRINDKYSEADVELSPREVTFFKSERAHQSGVIVASQIEKSRYHLTFETQKLVPGQN